ncbi:sulfatase family protein [Rubritalea marina]|uniref:sulfatase family protein n=1 Tax=Rubritalea marina TaxID=361055 RepID=UPI00036654D8|nr:sulfatase [Rubritalea marina]
MPLLRHFLDFSHCLIFPALLSLSSISTAASPPNIIFFLADDQRDDALACYGNPIVQSPTIDRLAMQGTRFKNSFCEVPICAASRASILTGVSQRTHGYNFLEDPVSKALVQQSYPALLKEAGYQIGVAGKLGVQFEGATMNSYLDFYHSINRNPFIKTLADGSKRHETDLCADSGITFIESVPEGTPFCLSIGFNATHAEDGDRRPGFHFQWPESADGLYEDIEIPAPKLASSEYYDQAPDFLKDKDQLNRKRYYWRWDTPEKYTANMRAYYRMVTGIDNAMTRVLEVLEQRGLADNTIIIYSADNGLMMGDRGMAGKWNHYEQSLRVPLIIYDPRVPQESRGNVVEHLVNNIDLTPTIVDLAELEIPEGYQGKSLTPFLKGQAPEQWRQDTFVEHHFKLFENWHGVRSERYKYAVYYDQEKPYECLYDLKNDPNEKVNRAKSPEYEKQLEMMRQRLDHYLQRFPKRELEQKEPGKAEA